MTHDPSSKTQPSSSALKAITPPGPRPRIDPEPDGSEKHPYLASRNQLHELIAILAEALEDPNS